MGIRNVVWVVAAGCAEVEPQVPTVFDVGDLAQIQYGWSAELVAHVDQSYAGWDVEIADLDGDGQPEILTGSAPDSRIYRHQLRGTVWQSTVIVDRLAEETPGMVLGVRVVDLDGDGRRELIAGTGQEDRSIAQFAIIEMAGESMTGFTSVRAPDNTSSFTHGLPSADVDGDGVQEVFSSYCGNGEVIRYDVPAVGAPIESRKVLQLSGSGEDATLADIDAMADSS